jgi:hypothetical protein
MPVRKRKTKAIKAKGPIQTVKQSVKVVIQAPAKPVRRRRATTAGKRDMLRGLMRAPEFTTFRDLTPVPKGSTQQPLDLNQLRLAFQDAIGSVSGGLNIAPKGLLPPPKEEEEKKSNDDAPEEIIVSGVKPYNPRQDQTLEELRLSSNEYQLRQREIKKAQQQKEKQEKQAREEASKQRDLERRERRLMEEQDIDARKMTKADAFRTERLGRMVFQGLRENVLLSKSGPKEPLPPFVPTQPPPPPPPRKMVTTQQAINKMKSIAKKAN